MDAIIEFGLEASLWLQETFPTLLLFMEIVSALGVELAYLLFLPFVYWCWNKAYGRQFAYVFLISTYFNFMLKHTFRQPRPFWLDETLNVTGVENGGYGVPSGHVQSATVTALFFAYKIRKTAVWWLAILYIALMMLSRIYLGVHFVHDAVFGLLIGLIILAGYVIWMKQLHKSFTHRILGFRLMVAVLVPVVLALLYTALIFLIGEPNSNVAWFSFFEVAELESIESVTTALSSLLGTGIGLVLEKSRVRFRVAGPLWQRALRYIVGIVVAGGIWAGLGQLFPDEPLALAIPLRVLRYTLLTLWVTYYGPRFFVLTRLAQADPDPGIDLTIPRDSDFV